MKLKYKLLLLLLCCTILPLTINVWVSYQSINQRLKNELIAQYKSQAEKLNQSFELSIRNVDNSILSIYQTAELYTFVTDRKQTDAELIAHQRRSENLLKILAHSLNDFSNVYLYLNDRKQLFQVSAKYLNVQHQVLTPAEDKDWIRQTQLGNGELVIVHEEHVGGAEGPLLFVGRSIPDVIQKRQAGVIGIDLGKEYFENIVGADNVLEKIEVINDQGQLFYSKHLASTPEGEQLLIESRSNAYGWKVKTYLSQRTLNQISWEAVRPMVGWGFLFMMAAIVLWVMLSRQISIPLYNLVRRMREVGKGNFKADSWNRDRQRKDEFGFLELQFFSMVDRVDELIKHEYQLKTNESVARMQALQAQINPHFLYNTLTSIYSEALEAGADNVCRMVKSLSSMFRYTTEFHQERVPLSAELQHVQNYLEIQKFRFEDKLEFKIDIPVQWMDLEVLKLSLQPIVENAIVHGISRTGKGWIMLLASYDEDNFCITVADSCGRITEEEAAELTKTIQSDKEWSASVGLKNVHQRIIYLFPGSKGIAIETENGWTQVKISWKASEPS
ncbi:sensor histidine kinase [Paenibacillus sp. MCAF9]|uniref:sensor histidine kinase n=1 Tax=Paenibacillus sp. MCAF9 TaxID=3233046 RepID=UPI003F9E2C8A